MAAHDHYGMGRPRDFSGAWLTHIRLSRLIFMVLVILIVVPLVAHYFLSNLAMESGAEAGESHRSRELHEEISSSRAADLRYQIDELKRIKASVNNELRDLENRRQRLHAEISGYNTHIDQLKNSYEQTKYELDQLKVTIDNTRLEQEEIVKRNMPQVHAPKRILPPLEDLYIKPTTHTQKCRMHSCFDFSRCSLMSGFPVYLYNIETVAGNDIDLFIKLSVSKALKASSYLTTNPSTACIYMVLLGDIQGAPHNASAISVNLRQLPYWNGDGRNHILLNLGRYYGNVDVLEHVDIGRALVVQSAFTGVEFRPQFDVVIPPSLGLSTGDVWDELSPIVPASRKHLLTFHGDYNRPHKTILSQDTGAQLLKNYTLPKSPNVARPPANQEAQDADVVAMLHGANNKPDFSNLGGERSLNKLDQEDSNPNVMPHFRNLKSVNYINSSSSSKKFTSSRSALSLLEEIDNTIIETLKRIQTSYPSDNLHVEFSCYRERIAGIVGEWSLCGTEGERSDLLRDSTFALIIAPTNLTIASTTLVQVRLYEALKHGAIPVILGDHLQLPFSELLLWKRAVVAIPKARITELHFIIRSFADADILEMRRQGRIFWETYFGTTRSILDTTLATLRTRLKIPAAPIREEKSPSVFSDSFIPLREDIQDIKLQPEDILGPIEAAFPSPRYRRNFTTLEDTFNQPGDPFHSFPNTPFEPVMPGEAKFIGSSLGFRPIAKGEGGAGREFSEALGGNVPREQFTVVMLTYQREAVLIEAIARLKGLPHLNKVLVVWNNPLPPAEDLRWPEIGVEVKVIRTTKNSLNNRFLPYDAIETEAILSIDDDAHLRHDEIVFGFRVWRENRDRIVGFPGRFHAWDLKDQTWRYNSNYSCELSMVLTGAAFFHKYYSYMYSYVMPQAIRDKVDEYLNCEDLAMNFLVSHITRKPPIKVTSRWTFRCPGCPNALSVDDSHFNERHRCIDFFVKVYGYMPLLNTQFRVDSVLFKTRIPHDKQKCFKFI